MGNGNSKILGDLRPDEAALIENLRRQANNIVFEIGQIEVRKSRLMGSLYETEEKGREVLTRVGQRLEIPPNQTWKVIGGKAILLDVVSPPQPTPVVPSGNSKVPQSPQ